MIDIPALSPPNPATGDLEARMFPLTTEGTFWSPKGEKGSRLFVPLLIATKLVQTLAITARWWSILPLRMHARASLRFSQSRLMLGNCRIKPVKPQERKWCASTRHKLFCSKAERIQTKNRKPAGVRRSIGFWGEDSWSPSLMRISICAVACPEHRITLLTQACPQNISINS